jgi:hypothetical protein
LITRPRRTGADTGASKSDDSIVDSISGAFYIEGAFNQWHDWQSPYSSHQSSTDESQVGILLDPICGMGPVEARPRAKSDDLPLTVDDPVSPRVIAETA